MSNPLFPEAERENLVQNFNAVLEDFKAVARDADEMLRGASSNVNELTAAARQKIEIRLKDAKNRLAVAESLLRDKTNQVAEVADDYVRDNPWRAVGIAAGVGLVLGLIAAQRR